MKNKGIDWSKKCMYDGIGRPDLKPKDHDIYCKCSGIKLDESKFCKDCI